MDNATMEEMRAAISVLQNNGDSFFLIVCALIIYCEYKCNQ